MFKKNLAVNNQSMKKVLIISTLLIIGGLLVLGGVKNQSQTSEYLRIHIRANSNSEIDQSIKYSIKDAVVDVMIPFLSECKSKKEAELAISNNFDLIEETANKVFSNNGFSYLAKARLAKEEFPTRDYNGFSLEKGFYDALIIDLGSGKGNNWWCVVYPPLCFLKTNPSGQGVIYKSKIIKIIKSVIK